MKEAGGSLTKENQHEMIQKIKDEYRKTNQQPQFATIDTAMTPPEDETPETGSKDSESPEKIIEDELA